MDASARIAALQQRLDQQQHELERTRAELSRLTAPAATTTRRDWMRRAALLSGATVAAGVATSAAAGPAAADDGDPIRAGLQTDEASGTVVFVTGTTSDHGAFTVTDTPFVSMPAATEPAAVLGVALKTTTGHAGVAGVGTSYGVLGLGEGYGVYGRASGTGVAGVGGVATGDRCNGATFTATGAGSTGARISGETAVHASGSKHGVIATGGAGTGVSASGSRGGQFAGTAAAVNLAPTSHASHPQSGHAGDLVVDHHHRLWFCRGGTSWTRLA